MRRGSERPEGRELVREALTRASAEREPEIGRLLERVPEMLLEARRRRLAAPRDPVSAIVPLALRAVPRLAAATALLLLLSLALFVSSPSSSSGSSGAESSFDSLVLGGGGLADRSDPFYEALLGGENGDG